MDMKERTIVRKKLAKVFKDTRNLSKTKYMAETQDAIMNTKVYLNPLKGTTQSCDYCPVHFTENDTISEAINQYREGNKVTILNFADALIPGGLVKEGEITQEEDICRCTNLYETLIKDECIRDYYTYNYNNTNDLFSDRMIYSPNCTIFKESLNFTELTNPCKCDVITSPAPLWRSSSELYWRTAYNRIKGILKVSQTNNPQGVLILGAWGCGAFGGDPYTIGYAFGEALKEFKNFSKVIFAVKTFYDGEYNKKTYNALIEGYQHSKWNLEY